MTRKLLTLAAVVIVMGTIITGMTGLASAQHYRHHGRGYVAACNLGRDAHYSQYGYGSGGVTYEESVLRGMGAYNQSMAQANYLNAQAAYEYQRARAEDISNSESLFEAKLRLKAANAAARKPQRMSPEAYAAMVRREAPNRLNVADYNRENGRLHWPAPLASESFASERADLDLAFASRGPSDVGAGSEFYSRVRRLTTAAEGKLRQEVATLSPAEFIVAKKFLTGLAYEAQQPVGLSGLASAE